MPHARSLLSLRQLGRDDLERLWIAAAGWQEQRTRRRARFADRRVATIFEGPAMRTRLAFDAAIDAVGAHRVDLPLTLGAREPVADTAAVLSGAVDAVVVRVPAHATLLELADACAVPVVNAMTDAGHPVEIFSEAFSVLQRRGPLDDLVVVFVGADTNTLRSWCELTVPFGLTVRQVCPPGRELPAQVRDELAGGGAAGRVEVSHDLADVAGADVLYTDVWPKAAQTPGADREAFVPFRITTEVLDRAGPRSLLMHAMPVRRGDEVSAGAFADPRCVPLAAKRNLPPSHAAIVEWVLGG
ncbi:hypothetical protein MF406_08920 [Georgenia sp. TF02-10]|uniref:ornithine carbamoyltransferase n=1 Tax=Georgenia sp. TF02-10 TaxID=2917725 RepID=UPI001FA70127|nr:hypothetical protein [Georgenia sp. TF02-10]UNX53160.1 hypothetical protein MF406_08920 [Georgenia sp. TF02-10]